MSEHLKVATGHGDIHYWADRSFPGRPTVVLLHGLSANHTTWEGLVGSLKEKKLNTIALDQRGHGLSDMTRRPSLYRNSVFVEDLEKVVAQEKLERMTLVGYSYGGPVAIEYAARHPEQIEGLVLISANHVSPVKYMRLGLLSPVLYGFMQLLGLLLVWQRRKRYHYYRHGEASGYWQSTFRGLKTMPMSVNLWMLSQVFTTDFRALLPKISAPTLIVRAEGDPFFSAAEAADMARAMPNAKVVVPRHKSHFVATKAHEEIAEMVMEMAV